MQIIPAIDIKNGKCVRLTQGKEGTETIYGEDPLAMAMHWQEQGAKYLHLVDLDGAFQGKPINFEIIKNIIVNLSIPVEIGGGIRTLKTIKQYINAGADRIILGTKIATTFDFLQKSVKLYPGKIAASIDASEGKIVTEGWVKKTDITAISLAQKVRSIGVDTIIYTDIATDGMLKGPNFKGIGELANSLSPSTPEEPQVNLIASGGISNIEDIKKIVAIKGTSGIIIGKALYADKIKLSEALKYCTLCKKP
jgi:phosphoribosylformimino-5-aminoimidazole carboxamide ribotide isomerase